MRSCSFCQRRNHDQCVQACLTYQPAISAALVDGWPRTGRREASLLAERLLDRGIAALDGIVERLLSGLFAG